MSGVARESGRTVTLALSDASVVRDFYALDTHAGPSSELEERIGDLESSAAPILDALLAGAFPPQPRDKEVLSEFFAFQWLRGTGQRSDMTGLLDSVLKRIVQWMPDSQLQDDRRANETEQEVAIRTQARRKFISNGDNYSFAPSQNYLLEIMLDSVAHTADFFAARTWQLVEFADASLLTSDDPVTLWTPQTKQHVLSGIGAANAREIRVPLDRRHALVLAMPEYATQGEIKRRLSGKHAHSLNELTASNSHRWIFHHPSDAPMIGIKLRPRRTIRTE